VTWFSNEILHGVKTLYHYYLAWYWNKDSRMGITAGVKDVIQTMRIDNFAKGCKCKRRENNHLICFLLDKKEQYQAE